MLITVISARASGGEPQLFGYQFKTVLSGSMEPTFKTGSLILVEKLQSTTDLNKGDVISYYQDENNVVTHRIIDVISQGNSTMYQTQGDNNVNPDTNLVLSDNIIAKYSGITIPYLGYLLQFMGSPIGSALLLIIPGLMLIGYAIIIIRSAFKEMEEKTKQLIVENAENKIS